MPAMMMKTVFETPTPTPTMNRRKRSRSLTGAPTASCPGDCELSMKKPELEGDNAPLAMAKLCPECTPLSTSSALCFCCCAMNDETRRYLCEDPFVEPIPHPMLQRQTAMAVFPPTPILKRSQAMCKVTIAPEMPMPPPVTWKQPSRRSFNPSVVVGLTLAQCTRRPLSSTPPHDALPNRV